MRSARGPGRRPEPLPRSPDLHLDGGMIGKHQVAVHAPLAAPAVILADVGPSDEDVIDAGAGSREPAEAPEARGGRGFDLEVAGHDAEILAREPACPVHSPLELRLRDPHIPRLSRVEIDDQRAAFDAHRHRLPAFLRPRELPDDRQAETAPDLQAKAGRVQRQDVPGEDRAAHEDRVGLAFEPGAKEPRIQVSEMTAELGSRRQRTDRRTGGNPPEDVHPAPLPEPPKRPRRHLLQTHGIRLTCGHRSHHLLHVPLSSGRERVAVEDIPGADDHGTTLGPVPGRFAELINRQLDLFEQEDAEFLARVEEAERAYDRAGRDDAEEVYGRFQELVEFGRERLGERRDGYAATLDATAAEGYVDAFNDAVRRRLPRFALEIDEL